MKKTELNKFRDNYTTFTGQCHCEGLELAVHFDEKDEVKQYGARWAPDSSGRGGVWWMPANKVEQDVKKTDYGTGGGIETVRDLLNDKKMIVGHYGNVDESTFGDMRELDRAVEYELQNVDDGHRWFFSFYPKERMCYVVMDSSGGVWMTDVQARSQWEALVDSNTCVRNQ